MSARNALYQALMANGIPGTGHTPDRSTKASALIDATLTEAANRLRAEHRAQAFAEAASIVGNDRQHIHYGSASDYADRHSALLLAAADREQL